MRFLIAIILAVTTLTLASPVGATSLSDEYYVFDSRAEGVIIDSVLNFDLVSDFTYSASLSVSAPTHHYATHDYYAVWFALKSHEYGALTITNFTGPTQDWVVANPGDDVKVLKRSGHYWPLLDDNLDRQSGFYLQTVAESYVGVGDYTDGLLLTGGPAVYTFTFDFTLPLEAEGKSPIEQISVAGGFFNTDSDDPNRGYVQGGVIPEPSTVLLLASGLAGLMGWRWRTTRAATS